MGFSEELQKKIRVAILKQVMSSGTSGGTLTAGDWRIRPLNTLEGDSDLVTLSNGTTGTNGTANNFTITEAGRYLIQGKFPASRGNRHQSRLYNITDSSVEVYGTSDFSVNDTWGSPSYSYIYAEITITEAKTFRLEQRSQANATYSSNAAFGDDGCLANMIIMRLDD